MKWSNDLLLSITMVIVSLYFLYIDIQTSIAIQSIRTFDIILDLLTYGAGVFLFAITITKYMLEHYKYVGDDKQ